MEGSPVPVPFAAPAWLTPARVAIGTVAIGGALAAMPVVELTVSIWEAGAVLSLDFSEIFAVPAMIATFALSIACARHLIARWSAHLFADACRVGTVFGAFAPLAAGCVFVLGWGMLGGSKWLEELAFAMIVGITLLPAGGVFGVLFGAAYYVPLRAAVRARETPAHDDAEKTLATCGAWLAVVAVPCAAMPLFDWFRTGAALTALAGIALFATGTVRSRRRRAWLNAVALGQIAGWSIARGALERELQPLLPFRRARAEDYSAVLLADAELRATPYREKTATLVALVSPADV
jgi:hypothetical protein